MARRTANGDGSCRQVTSGRFAGKWRVQVIVQDARGAKRRLSRIFATQREGKDFLRSLQRDSERAAIAASREMTLSEWFHWLAENDWPESLSTVTIRGRLARFGKYAEERWGKVPLTKIDPLSVKQFYVELRDEGIGHATREAIKVDLVRAFNQAISPYRRVPSTWGNPFRIPIDQKVARDAVALTPNQARTAISSDKLDDRQRAILGVLLLGGLRLSEMMALTKGQISFKKGLVYVDRAVVVDYGGGQTVGLPKGGKRRAAVMCETLASCLRPIAEPLGTDDYLFPAASSNQPRMKKLVYATWRTIVRDARLPEEMTPHDCRLSHINWIEKLLSDVSSTTLKEHVGHAVTGVTELNYTRPLSSSQDLLRKGLDRLMEAQQS